MFAKGKTAGYGMKAGALELLPKGTRCCGKNAIGGICGYVVYLPDGNAIASAASACKAWEKAYVWAINKEREDKNDE